MFRAYLPEEWTLLLNIHPDDRDRGPFEIFCPMSSVATAPAMTSHKGNCVRYIPGDFLVDSKHVARNLRRTTCWDPFFQSRKCNSEGETSFLRCVDTPSVSQGGRPQDPDKLDHLWTPPKVPTHLRDGKPNVYQSLVIYDYPADVKSLSPCIMEEANESFRAFTRRKDNHDVYSELTSRNTPTFSGELLLVAPFIRSILTGVQRSQGSVSGRSRSVSLLRVSDFGATRSKIAHDFIPHDPIGWLQREVLQGFEVENVMGKSDKKCEG